MAAEEVYYKILEHLKKDGPLNTFRLASALELDRSKLLNFIGKLEKAGAVEVQHGVVKFLKFVVEEKKAEKPAEAKKTVSKPKKKVAKKRKKVKKKPVAPKTHAENKVLKSKAFGTPETKPLNELKEKILQLESKVEELEKKASAPPKIIKKTIVKEVPVSAPITPSDRKKRKKTAKKKVKKKVARRKAKKKTVRRKKKKLKEVKKKKPKRRKEKKKSKRTKKKSKTFKFPKFTFMKSIKQLKKPEFAKK